jgi:hypothetical protein
VSTPEDLPPDVAAELRWVRAEIEAMRRELPPPQPWHRGVWLPLVHAGHVELPERHYRLLGWLRRRVHRRAHVVVAPGGVNKQRRNSLWLLVTGLARTAFWLVLIGCVAAGLAHIAGFAWAYDLSQTVWFVALLSLYANLATDFGAVIASYAALVAADVHSQVAVTSSVLTADLAHLHDDVDQLAGLEPGEEAAELAASLKARLAGRPNGAGT